MAVVLVQMWALQERGIPGVRMAAGTTGGLSISTKALPLNEHKGSTILSIAADESGLHSPCYMMHSKARGPLATQR